jgi:hypothetical protein
LCRADCARSCGDRSRDDGDGRRVCACGRAEGFGYRLVRLSPEVSEEVGQAFDLALSGLATPVLDAQLPSFDAAFDASLVVMGSENWAALGLMPIIPAWARTCVRA